MNATCKTCGAAIVWLKTSTGKAMPVDAGTVQEGETLFVPGRHTSHFATCPQADQHRKPRQQRGLFDEEK